MVMEKVGWQQVRKAAWGVCFCVCRYTSLSVCVYACVGDEAEQDWIHKTNANKTETRMQSGSP